MKFYIYIICAIFIGLTGNLQSITSESESAPATPLHLEPLFHPAYTRNGVSVELDQPPTLRWDPRTGRIYGSQEDGPLLNTPLTIWFFITSNKEDLGFIVVDLYPNSRSYDGNKSEILFYISHVSIKDGYQKKGYGSKALETLLAGLKTEPFFQHAPTLIKLQYLSRSPWLSQFYGKFGFKMEYELFGKNDYNYPARGDTTRVAYLNDIALPIRQKKAATTLQRAWRTHKARQVVTD